MTTNNNGQSDALNTRTITIIKSDKSAVTALLLCMFLGGMGIHRFYVGKIGTGILMLITGGGFGIWTLIDLINIACCNFTDDQGHYLEFTRRSSSPFMQVLWILSIILAMLIIYVALIVSFVFYATSGLTNTARGQLTAIRMHDYKQAYAYTSSAFQKGVTLDQFSKFVSSYPSLKNNMDSTFNDRSVTGDNTGTLKGTLKATDGSTTPVIYEFVKENGVWKIQNIEVNPSNTDVAPKATTTDKTAASAKDVKPEDSGSDAQNKSDKQNNIDSDTSSDSSQ
jgi:hypothetical protein